MPLSTLNKGCFIFLQATGKGAQSALISFCREVVFEVGLPIIMPVFFGLNGILYSFPCADLLTFLICLFVLVQIFKELNVPQNEGMMHSKNAV